MIGIMGTSIFRFCNSIPGVSSKLTLSPQKSSRYEWALEPLATLFLLASNGCSASLRVPTSGWPSRRGLASNRIDADMMAEMIRNNPGWNTWRIIGWWYTYPSEKYEFVSWDYDIPNIWKVIKTVPNHQPDKIWNKLRPRRESCNTMWCQHFTKMRSSKINTVPEISDTHTIYIIFVGNICFAWKHDNLPRKEDMGSKNILAIVYRVPHHG